MSENYIFKSSVTKQTYSIPLEAIKELIADGLKVDPSEIQVEYVIGDVGLGDPMDRFPAPRGVVEVKVTHTKR